MTMFGTRAHLEINVHVRKLGGGPEGAHRGGVGVCDGVVRCAQSPATTGLLDLLQTVWGAEAKIISPPPALLSGGGPGPCDGPGRIVGR